jgi:hypothetical protein
MKTFCVKLIGNYVPISTIVQPIPVFAKRSNPMVIAARSVSPPSIPVKSQSHGYEVSSAGDIKLQPPAIPGYSGKAGDSVGPGDYNPKVDVKFRSAPKPVFSTVRCCYHSF